MAEEAVYQSGADSAAAKRKYEDSTTHAPPSSARRVTGFSSGPASSPGSAPSYNSVPPPMDEIQLAKQKAQEIAARLFNNAEAKRPKFENGGGVFDSNDNRDFSSGPTEKPIFTSSSSYGYGYGNPSKKIEIPSGKVGVIIGKGGETIKYLQQQCGAKIQITRDSDADPHSLTRQVELTGSAESIAHAEQLIKDVLAEADAGGSGIVSRRVSGGGQQFAMKIPTNKVGLVIGKGGETIKSMQATTGARIQVIPLHPPPGDTSTERTVQIDGTSEQIEAAKQLVEEVISENRQRNSNPVGGGGGYSQAQPPTSWAGQGQQQGYGYTQYPGYPPQQQQQQQQQAASASSGYWDQSAAQGYDYYGQQQAPAYGYSQPQAQASYAQDAYGYGYAYPQTQTQTQTQPQPQLQTQTQTQTTDGDASESQPSLDYTQPGGGYGGYAAPQTGGYGQYAQQASAGYGQPAAPGSYQPPVYPYPHQPSTFSSDVQPVPKASPNHN